MDRLPYELLSQIFAQVSQEDLVNLPFSVVSRGLSKKDILARFSTIDVWLDQRSLNTLRRVAQHPFFSPSIRGLRFHPDDLASVGPRKFRHGALVEDCEGARCFVCYKADQQSVIYTGDEKASLTSCKDFIQEPDSATKRFLRYKLLYDAQQSMKEQEKDYTLLTKALRRFHSLPAVIIDFHYGFSSRARWRTLLGDAWVHQCEPLHPRRAGSRLFKMLMRALARCNHSPREFGIHNTTTPRLSPRPDIQYLPEIQRLLMAEEDCRLRKNIPGFPPIPKIFANLRKFILCSHGDPTDDTLSDDTPPECSHCWEGWQYRKYGPRFKIDITLGFILNQCEMLEDLEINFASEGHVGGRLDRMPYLSLIRLLNPRDPLRRPPLRNLKVSNFKIREPELVKFLRRYSETLRTIHFKNLFLISGLRETVLRLVQDEMKLSSAIFQGIHQASASYSIDEDYRVIYFRNTLGTSGIENTVQHLRK